MNKTLTLKLSELGNKSEINITPEEELASSVYQSFYSHQVAAICVYEEMPNSTERTDALLLLNSLVRWHCGAPKWEEYDYSAGLILKLLPAFYEPKRTELLLNLINEFTACELIYFLAEAYKALRAKANGRGFSSQALWEWEEERDPAFRKLIQKDIECTARTYLDSGTFSGFFKCLEYLKRRPTDDELLTIGLWCEERGKIPEAMQVFDQLSEPNRTNKISQSIQKYGIIPPLK